MHVHLLVRDLSVLTSVEVEVYGLEFTSCTTAGKAFSRGSLKWTLPSPVSMSLLHRDTAVCGAGEALHKCGFAAVLELDSISATVSVTLLTTHAESSPGHLFRTVRHVARCVLKPGLGKTQRKVLKNFF